MTQFYTVHDLMDEDEFWQLVEDSLAAAQARSDDIDEQQNIQYETLKAKLMTFSWQDIVKFNNRFDALYTQSYKDDLWCAAYILNGGCSDDGFDYFRAWLIAQGKKAFYDAMNNPDSLADLPQVNADAEYYEFEMMLSVPSHAFEEAYQADIYGYLNNRSYGGIGSTWDEDDEDSMRKICPKLMKRFWDE